MTEVEAAMLKIGEPVMMRQTYGQTYTGHVIEIWDQDLTPQLGMELFGFDPITATQKAFDGPILWIAQNDDRIVLWPPYLVHYMPIELEIQCCCCRNYFSMICSKRDWDYYQQSGIPSGSLNQSERELLVGKLCSGCVKKVVK